MFRIVEKQLRLMCKVVEKCTENEAMTALERDVLLENLRGMYQNVLMFEPTTATTEKECDSMCGREATRSACQSLVEREADGVEDEVLRGGVAGMAEQTVFDRAPETYQMQQDVAETAWEEEMEHEVVPAVEPVMGAGTRLREHEGGHLDAGDQHASREVEFDVSGHGLPAVESEMDRAYGTNQAEQDQWELEAESVEEPEGLAGATDAMGAWDSVNSVDSAGAFNSMDSVDFVCSEGSVDSVGVVGVVGSVDSAGSVRSDDAEGLAGSAGSESQAREQVGNDQEAVVYQEGVSMQGGIGFEPYKEDKVAYFTNFESPHDISYRLTNEEVAQITTDLFDGDRLLFNEFMHQITQYDDLNEALIFIQENYSWNSNSPSLKLIVDLLNTKLS